MSVYVSPYMRKNRPQAIDTVLFASLCKAARLLSVHVLSLRPTFSLSHTGCFSSRGIWRATHGSGAQAVAGARHSPRPLPPPMGTKLGSVSDGTGESEATRLSRLSPPLAKTQIAGVFPPRDLSGARRSSRPPPPRRNPIFQFFPRAGHVGGQALVAPVPPPLAGTVISSVFHAQDVSGARSSSRSSRPPLQEPKLPELSTRMTFMGPGARSAPPLHLSWTSKNALFTMHRRLWGRRPGRGPLGLMHAVQRH